jgi:hypothetical protein
MTKLAYVSSFGRIKTTQGVITKPNKNADGYPVRRLEDTLLKKKSTIYEKCLSYFSKMTNGYMV